MTSHIKPILIPYKNIINNVVKTKRVPVVDQKPKPLIKLKQHDDSVINILSLGAGVQSSTLLLMSLYGEIPPLDYVIFADTGWEPTAVYKHLEKLKKICYEAKLPLITVSVKDNSNIYNDPFNDKLLNI